MKTAEEILQSKEDNRIALQHPFGKTCIIEAMEEYANQFKPSLVSEGEINKLPTDDDIEKNYPLLSHFTQEQKIMRAYLIQGAKWMRDQIKQGLQYTNQSDNSGNNINKEE